MEEHRNVSDYTRETAQRLIDTQKRVIDAVNKAKAYDKGRFDADKVDSTFKEGEVVWFEMEKVPNDLNRKLVAKYNGPYTITRLLEGTHDLNVEITHTNNANDIRNVNIRKLKRAILRPEHVDLVPKEAEAPLLNKGDKKNKNNKDTQEKGANKLNPKGRTVRTQNIRAGKTKRVVEDRDEYEVEDIIDETSNTKTGETMYLVKWKGYSTKQSTWEPLSNLTNAKDIVNEWNRKQLTIKAVKDTIQADNTKTAEEKGKTLDKTIRKVAFRVVKRRNKRKTNG